MLINLKKSETFSLKTIKKRADQDRMALKVYTVDDSKLAGTVMSKSIQRLEPDSEIHSFIDPRELIKKLSLSPKVIEDKPLVITDLNMPKFDGMEVLAWVKRHPDFHFLPVVFISAEGDMSAIDEAEKGGAMGFLHKPLEEAALQAILKKVPRHYAEVEILQEIEATFPDESQEIIEELRASIRGGIQPQNYKMVYRAFHTIKGNARSIHYPVLASFIHRAESFLKAVAGLNLYSMPKTNELVLQTIDHIDQQLEKVRKHEQMSMASPELEKGFSHYLGLLDQDVDTVNFEESEDSSPAVSVSEQAEAQDPNSPMVSRTANSIRIKNEKLDEIQGHFKSIMQHRVKIARFANQLKSEFYDEAFPDQLLKIVDDMTGDTTNIMDFFISLRVVSIRRLKNFLSTVAAQTSEQLEKEIAFEFLCDDNAEIDQAVSEELENSLSHVLRNCIDHGVESAQDRTAAGKDPAGKVRVEIQLVDNDHLEITVNDDGRGINQEKLKAKVLETGIMTENSLSNLNEEQILDLIFLDNLSTKEDVSELSGRGVGMSAVKEAINKLGGEIKVESTQGKGSTFHLRVPRFFKL